MFTGFDCSKELDRVTNKAYTGYYDPAKKNALFKNALYQLIEKKYKTLTDNATYDELRGLYAYDDSFSLISDKLLLGSYRIESIVQQSGSLVVTLNKPHALATGDVVYISNVEGVNTLPIINGSHTVSAVINELQFELSFSFILGNYTNVGMALADTKKTNVANYYHPITVRGDFKETLDDLYVEKTTNNSPVKVTFNKPSKIRDGSCIQISGYAPNGVINTVAYCKMISKKSFKLYQDKTFNVPISSTTTTDIDGGTVTYIHKDKVMVKRKENEDINELKKPSYSNPAYDVASDCIIVQPLGACEEVKIQYIKEPTILIDVNDKTIDLTEFYTMKFLYRLVNEAALMMALELRDAGLGQGMTNQIIMNP